MELFTKLSLPILNFSYFSTKLTAEHLDLLVYTREITPRVEYIFRFVLKDILRLKYRVTSSVAEAQNYYGPKLSYSRQGINASVQVVPCGLLVEEKIREHSFDVQDWDGVPAFPLTSSDSEIPFDIFSAAFYLITRYEEYTGSMQNRDRHGRYKHSSSMAARKGFLHLPVVDLWAFKLLDVLNRRYDLDVSPRQFSHITTFDLDSAYAVKGKSFARVMLSAFSLMCSGHKPDFIRRLKVYFGQASDPYDIYETLLPSLPGSPQVIWFVHAGKWGEHDKSISLNSIPMRRLMGTLAERFRIGVHPSYHSFLNELAVRSEISSLVDVLEQAVLYSRQHYLRLRLPFSYRILVKLGIVEDYSMGYPDAVGFRAGTCTPFIFFDLIANRTLNLKVYPFQVMDSTLAVRQKLTPDESIEKIKQLIGRVKQVNGTFISIWHVDYLSGYQRKNSWLGALMQMLNHLKAL